MQAFYDCTKELGLRSTKQRETIAKVVHDSKAHQNAETILEKSRVVDESISLATVYRTLKLLQECGLVQAHRFGDAEATYECSMDEKEHHDHLICTQCNSIVEFMNDDIERLQNEVAKSMGFRIFYHKMELYGLCTACMGQHE